jgi:hypothetical protein
VRRLALAGVLSLGIVTALTLGLVTAPTVTAAQKVAATLQDADKGLKLRGFQEPSGARGLEIAFVGADGERQAVRVFVPSDFEQLSTLPVRFNDAPTETTFRECLRDEAYVPRDATGMPHQTCSVFSDDGPIAILVQTFPKRVPDFGGSFNGVVKDVYVSTISSDGSPLGLLPWVYPNPTTVVTTRDSLPYAVPGLTSPFTMSDAALLQAYPRWSKFYSGSRARSATNHFPLLFGSLTFAGIGVYGPGNRYGSPTNEFGRNVYIDTLDSDYGPGWRRVMGVLTQPKNGTFCYEFAKKGGSGGKTGVSTQNTYRITVIGPSLTPVLSQIIKGPTFSYGNASYNPLTDKWGTNFSPEQTAALIQQTATMGPNWRRPVKGTDCAYTLRQLPDGFIPPIYTVAP